MDGSRMLVIDEQTQGRVPKLRADNRHRMAAGPARVEEQYDRGTRIARFNAALAVAITKGVGSMWCAYAFAVVALIGLPGAINGGVYDVVQWIAQTFLQLVLLSIILVGPERAGRCIGQAGAGHLHRHRGDPARGRSTSHPPVGPARHPPTAARHAERTARAPRRGTPGPPTLTRSRTALRGQRRHHQAPAATVVATSGWRGDIQI